LKKDPLIDEIRAARHRISARFGHDTKALLDHYREMEKQYADRVLRTPPDPRARKVNNEDLPPLTCVIPRNSGKVFPDLLQEVRTWLPSSPANAASDSC
jgi:hypothetical protein